MHKIAVAMIHDPDTILANVATGPRGQVKKVGKLGSDWAVVDSGPAERLQSGTTILTNQDKETQKCDSW